MDLSTITMDKSEAREKFLEYKRAVKARHDAEDEAIMKGYRALAMGKQLIHLPDTMRAGGVVNLKYKASRWNGSNYASTTLTAQLPALAVLRAHHRECWLNVANDGSTTMLPDKFYRGHKDRFFFKNLVPEGNGWHDNFRAMVPIVPAGLRPAAHLRNYHILWEAEWEHATPPPPPRDPALLKHIGGELYAVVAIWNLTDLERAVLGARIR